MIHVYDVILIYNIMMKNKKKEIVKFDNSLKIKKDFLNLYRII